VRKTANLITNDFWDADWRMVDGHEEIEIALLKLAEETGETRYCEMAGRFLKRRHAKRGYAFLFLNQAASAVTRLRKVANSRKSFLEFHPDHTEFKLPKRNLHKTPVSIWPRLIYSLLSGKFSQRNADLNTTDATVGHSVRFAYLETAAAMLSRQTGKRDLIPGMEKSWENMVTRRMYVTGGIGSLPLIEGFGRDDELDPEVAYTETCAALGSLFWNREMALLTGDSRYDDLFEWQLYNAALVGIGGDGCTYFYNNPLVNPGRIQREPWYEVPCCPSNISRTWASIGTYLYSCDGQQITIHQYAGSEAELKTDPAVKISVDSGLPWAGNVKIKINMKQQVPLSLKLRIPWWTEDFKVNINGEPINPRIEGRLSDPLRVNCGLDFSSGGYIRLHRDFEDGDEIKLDLGMPIRVLRQDPRVRSCRGMAAITRGPLVYCLESVDNPEGELIPRIEVVTLKLRQGEGFFQGIPLIEAINKNGEPLIFIPYFMWGNRGRSRMSVFFYP
jgi:uncharacterized protein